MVKIRVESLDRLADAIEALQDLPATGHMLRKLAAITMNLQTVLDEADERDVAPRHIRAGWSRKAAGTRANAPCGGV